MNKNNIKYSLFELYEHFKKYQKIELKKFILLLDWLYLIDMIKITDDGCIVKCS
ncbi:ABC-three component system middle component 6 [Hydrogenimonas thermophila]|uniref:ABC-three component system middle component 6 n=1 Tax=Hydrogenimonas thermophila TaxID=223786 RepID=UPI003CCC1B5A